MAESVKNKIDAATLALEYLEKGKEFAKSLSPIALQMASVSDFYLGIELIEFESGEKSKVFELKQGPVILGRILILYSDEKYRQINAMQVMNSEGKTLFLEDLAAGIQVLKGKDFFYHRKLDRVRFQKLTNLSDITALLHEFGHAFEDKEKAKNGLIASAKLQIRDKLFDSRAADFVYTGKGSNFQNLIESLNAALKALFPREKDYLSELQLPISADDLNCINLNEENADLYSIERLIEILLFLGVEMKSDLFERILIEQSQYAAVSRRTHVDGNKEALGFDPVQMIAQNLNDIKRMQIAPKDQTMETA